MYYVNPKAKIKLNNRIKRQYIIQEKVPCVKMVQHETILGFKVSAGSSDYQ